MRKLLPFLPFAAVVIVAAAVEFLQPAPLDWTPTFSPVDKIPWGTYVLYQMLPDLFPADSVKLALDEPIRRTFRQFEFPEGNMAVITASFAPDEEQTANLLAFARHGSTVFIAAQDFPRALRTALGFGVQALPSLADTVVCLDGRGQGYPIRVGGFSLCFDSLDTKRCTVLGTDAGGHPTFIEARCDQGRFLLHSVPWAFANYNMLKEENASYAGWALSRIDAEKPLLWGAYLLEERAAQLAPLSFLLAHDALRWGYLTALGAVVVFVFMSARRRQRVIPVVGPSRNETLAFVGTIARLHYRRSHHKAVALRLRGHLLDVVRSRYRLAAPPLDAAFAGRLARRTGMPEAEAARLVEALASLDRAADVGSAELLSINASIERFYQLSRRR